MKQEGGMGNRAVSVVLGGSLMLSMHFVRNGTRGIVGCNVSKAARVVVVISRP